MPPHGEEIFLTVNLFSALRRFFLTIGVYASLGVFTETPGMAIVPAVPLSPAPTEDIDVSREITAAVAATPNDVPQVMSEIGTPTVIVANSAWANVRTTRSRASTQNVLEENMF